MFDLRRKGLFGTCLILAMLMATPPLLALDDPTMPAYLRKKPVKKRVKKPQVVSKPLRVSSILVSPQRTVTIINNKVLRVGDVVDNATVLDIQRNRVIVRRHGKQLSLQLQQSQSVRKSYR